MQRGTLIIVMGTSNLNGRLLVINEWLIHDLRGDNGIDAQVESALFLQAFEQSNDRLAILDNSPWMAKFYELMDQTGPQTHDPFARRFSQLIRALLELPDKCIYLYQPAIAAANIPQDAIAAAPQEDIYLIQLYYAAHADLLITTDHGLHNAFATHPDIAVTFRHDFLPTYPQ